MTESRSVDLKAKQREVLDKIKQAEIDVKELELSIPPRLTVSVTNLIAAVKAQQDQISHLCWLLTDDER